MYLDKAKKKEEALHQVGFEDLVPCTEDEIAFLERWLKRPCPQAYREFLHWMGYWGGGLFVGSDFFYERLMNMQEWARALLEEDHYPGELPEDAFVFFMHQGYRFYFFRFSEGADPRSLITWKTPKSRSNQRLPAPTPISARSWKMP
jgi:hypothetical protein